MPATLAIARPTAKPSAIPATEPTTQPKVFASAHQSQKPQPTGFWWLSTGLLHQPKSSQSRTVTSVYRRNRDMNSSMKSVTAKLLVKRESPH